MNIVVRNFGTKDYQTVWDLMSGHTNQRKSRSQDEFWFTQHLPVYTLGKAGKEDHILDAGAIPVVKSDRGGQVTYHGPGQAVVYTLLDVKRLKIGPRELVRRIESGIIEYLSDIGIQSGRKEGAPGVYVGGSKIAALGLRIRNGFSYHGLAINVDMDLEPYIRINPCGYKGQQVTQIADILLEPLSTEAVVKGLLPCLFGSLYQDRMYSVTNRTEFDELSNKIIGIV